MPPFSSVRTPDPVHVFPLSTDDDRSIQLRRQERGARGIKDCDGSVGEEVRRSLRGEGGRESRGRWYDRSVHGNAGEAGGGLHGAKRRLRVFVVTRSAPYQQAMVNLGT